MIKYSFIVPVYNTEKYLKKCLDSLVNQTYKDFEIIVVNDGSTDKSSSIISKYQKKYKNIIVIDKENEGLSMARNRGVQKSSGKYIIFVDSDDYVSNKLLEEVDKKIDDSDILRFQIATEDEEYTKINKYHEEGFESMRGYDAFKYLSSYHFVEPAWCYVIRKNYYIENKFSFKRGVYHEDFGLIPYVIYKARKVKSIDFIGYYYIQRNGSIMNNNDYKKTVKKAFDMLEQYTDNLFYIIEFRAYNEVYLVHAKTIKEFKENNTRKSIPYNEFKKIGKLMNDLDVLKYIN